MIYLYVPFKSSEGNQKLIQQAIQWYRAAYEGRAVSCIVLSADDVFVHQDLNRKSKIYILSYLVDENTESLAPLPNSISCATIDTKELVARLLASKLPATGSVEIKLCLRQNEDNDSLLISPSLVQKYLLEKNYNNKDIVVRVQCSAEPYPGEIMKQSYRSLTGRFSLFNENSKLVADALEPEEDLGDSKNISLIFPVACHGS